MAKLGKFLALMPWLLITGCNSNTASTSNSPLCIDVAAPVSHAVPSFTVSEHLSRTYAYYPLAAMQPGAPVATDVEAAIGKMDEAVGKFIRYTGPASNIVSTTNELDLLESIIASDTVENLVMAKASMVESVQQSLACGYNNQNIRLTTMVEGEVQEKLFTLSYNYAPNAATGSTSVQPILTKTLIHKQPNGTSSTFSPVAVVKLDPASFQGTGYNPVKFLQANYGGNDESLILRLDRENRLDSLAFNSATSFKLNETYPQIKRVRFEMPYDSSQVQIFASRFLVAYAVPDGTLLEDPSSEQLKAVYKTWGQPKADSTYDGATNTYAYPVSTDGNERRLYSPTEASLEDLYQRWGAVLVPRYQDPAFDNTADQSASPSYQYQGTLVTRVNQ